MSVILQGDIFLRHYDKGPCRNKLGHSRASVMWNRTQVRPLSTQQSRQNSINFRFVVLLSLSERISLENHPSVFSRLFNTRVGCE